MSLNESRDAIITRIMDDPNNPNNVIAEIASKIDGDQRQLFLRHSELLKFDARSTLARFGINVTPIDDLTWENGNIANTVRISSFIPEYLPQNVKLEQLLETGVPVGKYFINDESQYLETNSLFDQLEHRQVITREGTKIVSHGDYGILRVPLQNIIYVPTEDYSEQSLRDIIHKRIPRSRLTRFQEPRNVKILQVPSNGGIVTQIPLVTNGLEVIVTHPLHAEARMGSEHTKYEFFLEYSGNGVQDTELESIDIILSKPRQKQFKVYVPSEISVAPNTSLESNRSLENFIHRFELKGDNLRTIEYIDFSDNLSGLYRRLSRDDISAQKDFYNDFQNNKNVALIFNQFPGKVSTESVNGITDYLIRLSKEDILKTVYLNNATNGIFFSESALEDINNISENGTTVYWNNNSTNKWMVYQNGFWIKPDKLQDFIDYYNSGKLVAFYGSSKKMDEYLIPITEKNSRGNNEIPWRESRLFNRWMGTTKFIHGSS